MTAPLSSEHGLTALPDHLHGFALTHMAMRRDARRLVAAAPTLSPAALRTVADWWHEVRSTIEWHHHSEDELLWPELRRLVPGVTGAGAVLDDDHVALDEAMAEVSRTLGAGGAGLVAAAGRFDALLHDHLRREEAVVFPAFTTGMTVAQYTAVESRVISSAGIGRLGFILPWMFDGFSRRETGRADATIPPPIRLLNTTVLRNRYRRRWGQW